MRLLASVAPPAAALSSNVYSFGSNANGLGCRRCPSRSIANEAAFVRLGYFARPAFVAQDSCFPSRASIILGLTFRNLFITIMARTSRHTRISTMRRTFEGSLPDGAV